MRTIKFRGYNRKNEKWLYGFYLQNRGLHFVCPDEFATGKTLDDYEIDPETLGQFTGECDKNDTEIYEGDIVKFKETLRYRVVWLWFGFKLKQIGIDDCRDVVYRCHLDSVVIGNIHDNPELLTTSK